IECSSNSDCGASYVSGSPICSGNSVRQIYYNYTCRNPGTSSASCSRGYTYAYQSCAYGCENGACKSAPVKIECSSNSDCGEDFFTNTNPICYNGDVYQLKTHHLCRNSGKSNAYCQIYNVSTWKESCTDDKCEDGSCVLERVYAPSQQKAVVYRNRTCYNNHCEDGICKHEIKVEKQKVGECEQGCNQECLNKYINQYQESGPTFAGVQKCSDGTTYSLCSDDKPNLCNSGRLEQNCQNCGCPEGQECQKDGSCTKSLCIEMQYNGNPADKLDILFIGDDYSEYELSMFRGDANSFMNGLLSYEPFKSQRNKINVYRIDNTQDLGCNYNCQGIGRAICCDNAKVAQASVHCPKDYTIVIVNSNDYGGAASGGLAVSYRGDYKVAVHEFGHSFAGLMDEYNTGQYISGVPWGSNCAPDSSCSKWSDLKGVEGVGCFKGCTADNWYRPIHSTSVMMDLKGDYNPVGERAMADKMRSYR
ncbi:MAG: M64 family metallopeptidase, partial [Nanoarchaeota archaeon]|nr:M64 family metallopeptidase [Nanoarchaeota archaeon]